MATRTELLVLLQITLSNILVADDGHESQIDGKLLRASAQNTHVVHKERGCRPDIGSEAILAGCAGSTRAGPVNVRITAVRKLAVQAADNGLLAPELANASPGKGVASKGVRLANWLSLKQGSTS
jgi:hypothetical protein